MITYNTQSWRSYCITATTVPCVVTSKIEDGRTITLITITEPGQDVVVAPDKQLLIDQDDAVITPVFKGASIGKSCGGGKAMRDVIIPIMPTDGVVLSIGVNLTVTTPTNNLYVKAVGGGSGESRLFFSAETGGVLNVIAPVALKWLNGNKTHYVNAGDRVAVSFCNGLVTVGSYS